MSMGYDRNRHHRRSIRLKEYDYTQAGAYFVTVVAQNRMCLFGEVVDGVVRLNKAGRTIATEWCALPTRFPTVQLDAFVVMPNHIHSVTVIDPVGAPLVGAQSNGATSDIGATTGERATTRVAPTDRTNPAIGDIVGAFKSITTNEYAQGVQTSGWPPFGGRLWQRNYYEHIIRNESDLDRIRQYIADNPARWMEDPENPVATVGAPLVGAPSAAGATTPGQRHAGQPPGLPLPTRANHDDPQMD